MKNFFLFTTMLMILLYACTREVSLVRSDQSIQWKGHIGVMPSAIRPNSNNRLAEFVPAPLEDKSIAATPFFAANPPSPVEAKPMELAAVAKHQAPPKSTKSVTIAEPLDRKNKVQKNELRAERKPNSDKSGDTLLYGIASTMALAILGLFRTGRRTVTRLTRWAKAEPTKAQGLTTGLQMLLAAIAFFLGHNLRELGYHLSDITTYIFGILTALGFLAVPFWNKRKTIAIPKVVNRQRLGYLGIALSTFMMLTSFGNNFEKKYPTSPVTTVIKNMDHAMFATTAIQPGGTDNAKMDNNKQRQLVDAGLCFLAVVLILCLVVTLCAGVCLVIGGLGGIAAGGGAILAVLGGIGLTILSIMGMIRVAKWCK